MAKRRGRPRKPLPGGHRGRTPQPTEEAKLNAVLRGLTEKKKKRRSASPAKVEEREVTKTKDGRKILVLKKGHKQGRPEGSTNAVPRNVRASIKSIIEDVVTKRKATVRHAFLDGINGGPRHADRYLKLGLEYLDGRPDATLNLNARWNQDELASARESLGKKLDGILGVLMKQTEDQP